LNVFGGNKSFIEKDKTTDFCLSADRVYAGIIKYLSTFLPEA